MLVAITAPNSLAPTVQSLLTPRLWFDLLSSPLADAQLVCAGGDSKSCPGRGCWTSRECLLHSGTEMRHVTYILTSASGVGCGRIRWSGGGAGPRAAEPNGRSWTRLQKKAGPGPPGPEECSTRTRAGCDSDSPDTPPCLALSPRRPDFAVYCGRSSAGTRARFCSAPCH